MKILIVEDSLTQAEHLKHLLEMAGYTILHARSGHEALEILHRFNPELLISDVIMSGMNGYELCKMVRLNANFKKIPIILLTTLSDTEDVIQGLESGANYFLTKPYESEYLLKYIGNILNIQKMRQATNDSNRVKIILNDKEYSISADKTQAVDLLISIYDAAVRKNNELLVARTQLQELNSILERKVEERTAALRIEMEEKKLYEKQFIQAQKMESVGQLAGGIAHDFNNLLMIMQGGLELIKLNLKEGKINVEYLDACLDTVKRGAELTRRLLSFSRHQQLQPSLLNLKDTITNIIKLLSPILGESIQIKVAVSDNIWPVWLDAGQLENALVNLAINSRDAMNEKGMFIIKAENILQEKGEAQENNNKMFGDCVKISVSDTGPGIPPEIIERVFEPFFTTKEVGKGTGLGLSMVYGFMMQSNGQVTVESKPNLGTIVNLYLPKASVVQISENNSKKIPDYEIKGKETLLLVEDNKALRNITAKYLENLGYKILQAEDGIEALKIIKKKKIQLLLTDVIMPGELTGFELADQALACRPTLKIIFTSGYPRDRILKGGKTKIAHPILFKPYASLDLAILLRTALGAVSEKIPKRRNGYD